MKKIIVTVFTIGLVAVGIFIILFPNAPITYTEQVIHSDKKTSHALPDQWREYTNTAVGISLWHPVGATSVYQSKQKHIRVQFTGANQVANTELIDGFTVWVSAHSTSTPVNQYVENQYSTVGHHVNRLEDVTKMSVRNYVGYTFAVENQLGSVIRYIIWRGNDQRLYNVRFTVAGTNSDISMYQRMINTMIASIAELN